MDGDEVDEADEVVTEDDVAAGAAKVVCISIPSMETSGVDDDDDDDEERSWESEFAKFIRKVRQSPRESGSMSSSLPLSK